MGHEATTHCHQTSYYSGPGGTWEEETFLTEHGWKPSWLEILTESRCSTPEEITEQLHDDVHDWYIC